MTVVFDTSVFVSAVGSPTGSSRRCFVLLARRRFQLAVTKEILMEYEAVAERLSSNPGRFHRINWRPLYNWLRDKSLFFEPAPLGKQRSRDASDDIFIACALASGARIIASNDRDLLALEKPFGIEIVTPAVFVARHKTV
jgi:putative PIN family toxin of toxin-antitoxin system